ncbi:MAG: LysR family transcriptional regulator [Myxococcota bacterium]
MKWRYRFLEISSSPDMHDDVYLSALRSFCAAYEQGGFTEGARKLGLTPQSVSRAVARLEKQLGAPLFVRDTRGIEITPLGQTYYEGCSTALRLLDEAESSVRSAVTGTPSGVVRISVPTTIGRTLFLRHSGALAEAFPDVELEVEVSNRLIDFVKSGYDLAIRTGPPPEGSLIARKLGDFRLSTFASPSYLQRHGTPQRPNDLDDHRCATFLMPRTGKPLPWIFDHPSLEVTPSSWARITDDVTGLVSFALGGGGLAQMYEFLVEDHFERQELVEVLKPFGGRSRSFSLLYPRPARERPAVAGVIEFILERMRP